jgi:hypothetical protein
VDGAIGALVCAQPGAVIAKAVAIAMPLRSCFMGISLSQVSNARGDGGERLEIRLQTMR